MANINKAELHKVFPAELQGSTLIVSPKGDAVSFRDIDVHNETTAVMEILDDAKVVNLVVNLSGARYYGTTIIGALSSMGMKIREKGGQNILCGASDDMLDILRIMKLDTIWTQYATLRESLKALK